MTGYILHLDEQYAPLQHLIEQPNQDINVLYEEHGERIMHSLFLTQLLSLLASGSPSQNLVAIAGQLIEFELPDFHPPELVPIYDGPRYLNGEILHLASNYLVAKISSYQFPLLQLLLTVVARPGCILVPALRAKTVYSLSVVSL